MPDDCDSDFDRDGIPDEDSDVDGDGVPNDCDIVESQPRLGHDRWRKCHWYALVVPDAEQEMTWDEANAQAEALGIWPDDS